MNLDGKLDFHLDWPIFDGGYIATPDEDGNEVLWPKKPNAAVRVTSVPAHGTLFLDFAELAVVPDRGSERFIEFANAHGAAWVIDRPAPAIPKSNGAGAISWYDFTAQEFQHGVKLWNASKSDCVPKSLIIKRGVDYYQRIEGGEERYCLHQSIGDIGKDSTPSEICRVALANHLSLHLARRISVSVWPSPNNESLELFTEPNDLVSAMWLQFAFAVSGVFSIQKCEDKSCGKYFAITTKARGNPRRFCGDTCRKRASLARK